MPIQFTMPPDTRSAIPPGTPDPANDVNALIRAANALGITDNVLNAAFAGGADPSGGLDATLAINAVPQAGVIKLPAGTYLVNGASALALASAGTYLVGDGVDATFIKIGSSFSAAEVISINADWCGVRDLTIIGASSTLASNPQANAIEILARNADIRNVHFKYVNGYCIEHLNQTPGAVHQVNHQPHIVNIWMENTAGGIHFNGGVPANTPDTIGAIVDDINGSQIGGGTAGNLDALLITDAYDFLITNWFASVSNVGTGHSIHLVGKCSAFFFTGGDVGGYPIPATGSGQCGVKIESGANGNTSSASFAGGIFQTHDNAVSLQGACSNVHFSEAYFNSSDETGVIVNTTGVGIKFHGCTFGQQGNGVGATGTNYDLDWQATGHGEVIDCEFGSPIVTTGTPGVQDSIHFGASGRQIQVIDPRFTGASTTQATQIINRPIYVRVPVVTGTAVLSGGTAVVTQALTPASPRIVVRQVAPGGTPGALFVSSVTALTGFTITSTSASDASTVEYEVLG